ncbi:MAG: hypothetical protein B7Z08_00070 [Sphingomonadales bacterium 32-68-7]|nr:MAG: hypothetical protein B7Z33_08285 [Sphingomonadales bacterium 12-68-11]OYX10630.1 MAG: hypothetical protein B7Z08_00070 [Sphingomonadales bacterium 32-68-7]
MAKLEPPHAVRTLMQRGCMGDFANGTVAFNPDESVALVRYMARLMQERRAEFGDKLIETVIAVTSASLQRHRPARPLACGKGCAACCHQPVSVTAIEAFAIARKVRKMPGRDSLRARLGATPVSGGTAGRVFDAARPCPFLAEAACSIHGIRPLVCRIVVSFDARACHQQLDQPDGQIPWPHSHGAIQMWVNTALFTAHQAASLDPRTYALAGAVEAVLRDPLLEARWYAGDDGLLDVADPPLHESYARVCQELRTLARL